MERLPGKGPYLAIYFGPMTCSKTTRLVNDLTVASIAGLKVLYVNHSIDNRSTKPFSTHNDLLANTQLKFDTLTTSTLKPLTEKPHDVYDIFGIDEAQFFDPTELKDIVLHIVEKMGKYVIVTGLVEDYKRNVFGGILGLIPYCDRVEKLSAVCKKCAPEKIVAGKFTSMMSANTKDNSIVVGGGDLYQAHCRTCYLETYKNVHM
jgi:thymidine kinase